uniref:FHA domain-containing protein n=1 Tax=Guillardia theta TaxID=55529 RepID=A0A7S4KWU3_GUITH|mmetsp:Transcript_3275/g.11149  ORF Transcript_3275/g.11149 Transcript_3275/m.11149 type:complete len:701 (+) Transcript_3275:177-2279(+)
MSVVGYLKDVSEPENYHELYEGRTTVGRADGNDIKILSRSVSGQHAALEIDLSTRPPRMVLQDLGSRNATFLNDIRLVSVSRPFEWNDTVRFGYDTCTYRLVETLEQQPPRERKHETSVSAHLLPPAGIPSVTEMDLNRSVRSVSSPPRDARRGNRNEPDGLVEVAQDIPYSRDRREQQGDGRGGQKREEFEGIGFPSEDVEEPKRAKPKGRSRSNEPAASSRAPERAEAFVRRRDEEDDYGGRDYLPDATDTKLLEKRIQELERNAANPQRVQQTQEIVTRQEEFHNNHQTAMNAMPQAFASGNLNFQTIPAAPRFAMSLGNSKDIEEIIQEEEKKMQAELEKRRNDLNLTGNFNGKDETLTGNVMDHGDDRELQIKALVAQLSQKERQLEEIQSDDLARCLLDTQESVRQMRSALVNKDNEVQRLRMQLKELSSGHPEAFDNVILDSNSECLRLRREIDELKSRDLEASRRWSEQQAQLASFASRVKELELQLARQWDAAEVDAVARDSEIRAMNERMQEIVGSSDPSKMQAAKFLVDQVTEQEKAMRLQKQHVMQLEARLMELKSENEFLKNQLGTDEYDKSNSSSLLRLKDQLTELRAQGSVQRVAELEETRDRLFVDLQLAKEEIEALKTKEKLVETAEYVKDVKSSNDQVRASYIKSLEEERMRLEKEKALNRARQSRGMYSQPDPFRNQAGTE